MRSRRIFGLESLVEPVRAIVLEMARRRLSRAGEAKREVVKGSEELLEELALRYCIRERYTKSQLLRSSQA